jgi:hypothetical protein
MIGKDGVRYLFRAVCAMTSGNWSNPDDLQPGCGWKSGWYETSEAREAGRRHSPNWYTGMSSKIGDPSNKHMFSVERLAQNPKTGYGMDVRAEASADAAGSSRLSAESAPAYREKIAQSFSMRHETGTRAPNNRHLPFLSIRISGEIHTNSPSLSREADGKINKSRPAVKSKRDLIKHAHDALLDRRGRRYSMNSEKLLAAPVRRLFSDLLVLSEVPFGLKRIDLVFVPNSFLKGDPQEDDMELISVELKWQDWARALRQAYVNQLCCDRSYVAMPEKHLPVNLTPFHTNGVGLIAVNGNARVVVESVPEKFVDARFKKQFMTVVAQMLRAQKALFDV